MMNKKYIIKIEEPMALGYVRVPLQLAEIGMLYYWLHGRFS